MNKLAHSEISRLSADEYRSSLKHPITVVLDNIRSAYNVGSIFRTSDAARIERLILTGVTTDPMHKAVRKSGLGAEDVVAWERSEDILQTITDLKNTGYEIVALEITDDAISLWDFQPSSSALALIIGNEVSGVDRAVLDFVDRTVQIPQFGTKQSLNVSVAYGIAVMNIVKRIARTAADD